MPNDNCKHKNNERDNDEEKYKDKDNNKDNDEDKVSIRSISPATKQRRQIRPDRWTNCLKTK